MKIIHILFTAVFVVLVGSCASVIDKTNLSIEIVSQNEENGALEVDSLSKVFIFQGDTASLSVVSFEQAEQGTITSKLNGATSEHFAQGVYDSASESFRIEQIPQGDWVAVVCDQINNIYYYRNYETTVNLESLYLQLVVRPYVFGVEMLVDNQSPWIGKK